MLLQGKNHKGTLFHILSIRISSFFFCFLLDLRDSEPQSSDTKNQRAGCISTCCESLVEILWIELSVFVYFCTEHTQWCFCLLLKEILKPSTSPPRCRSVLQLHGGV